MNSCCTCAAILPSSASASTSTSPPSPPLPPPASSEKQQPESRRVECCNRVICGTCIHNNRRFAEYCPYCQISSGPSTLPPRLRDPPTYTSVPSSTAQTTELSDAPPPYTFDANTRSWPADDEKAAMAAHGEKHHSADDVLHFINHDHDSVASISLRYGIPSSALRRANNITSDHLLSGRRTVVIPGEFYKGGVSLSPRPIEGEEEELRKNKIRRFMTSCKVLDYDVALLYLEQASYILDAAVETYMADDAWEREHPNRASREKKVAAKPVKSRVADFWRRS